MARRFFVHKDDPSRKQELSESAGVVTLVQIRGQRRETTTLPRTLEAAVQNATLFGYLEVTEDGKPLAPTREEVPLGPLRGRLKQDPYGVFTEGRKRLPHATNALALLELLLDALDAIEADVDEHETANYNVYFPPTDEDEPTYDALHSYREHWRGLVARLRKRETLRVDEFEPPE